MVEALGKAGFTVRADKVGSREIVTQYKAGAYAFGWPSGAPAGRGWRNPSSATFDEEGEEGGGFVDPHPHSEYSVGAWEAGGGAEGGGSTRRGLIILAHSLSYVITATGLYALVKIAL